MNTAGGIGPGADIDEERDTLLFFCYSITYLKMKVYPPLKAKMWISVDQINETIDKLQSWYLYSLRWGINYSRVSRLADSAEEHTA